MKIVTLAAVVLLAAAAMATAEEPQAPTGSPVVCFRLEIGVEPGRIVEARLEFDAGGACVAALLDLDGDGKQETRQDFAEAPDPRTKRPTRDTKVRVTEGGAEWVLDIYSLAFARASRSSLGNQTYVHWSVTKGDFYAWFINVQMPIFGSLEAARASTPFRLGPPLTFETGSGMSGRNALVNVGLKDANGGTLRLARRGTVEVRPEVKLVAGGEEAFSASATYG